MLEHGHHNMLLVLPVTHCPPFNVAVMKTSSFMEDG